jgi:hypothetical protein
MYERDITRMQTFHDIPVELMKKIKAPAFIIIGESDVARPEHAVEMYRLLPTQNLPYCWRTWRFYRGNNNATGQHFNCSNRFNDK